LYSILHDPRYEDLEPGEEKKKISKRIQTDNDIQWRLDARDASSLSGYYSIGYRCDSETTVASRIRVIEE
jgi:hypothetical protein